MQQVILLFLHKYIMLSNLYVVLHEWMNKWVKELQSFLLQVVSENLCGNLLVPFLGALSLNTTISVLWDYTELFSAHFRSLNSWIYSTSKGGLHSEVSNLLLEGKLGAHWNVMEPTLCMDTVITTDWSRCSYDWNIKLIMVMKLVLSRV